MRMNMNALKIPHRAQKPLPPREDARSQLLCRGTPSDHPDLDFKTSELYEIKCIVYKLSSLWYFVTAA